MNNFGFVPVPVRQPWPPGTPGSVPAPVACTPAPGQEKNKVNEWREGQFENISGVH